MYDYLKICITVYSINIHKCISCVRNASCFSKNAPCKDKKRAVTSSQRSFPHMSDGRPAAGWNWLMSNSCNRAGLWCSSIQFTLMVSYCQVRHRMSLSCVVIICEIQFQSLQLGLTMTTEVHTAPMMYLSVNKSCVSLHLFVSSWHAHEMDQNL